MNKNFIRFFAYFKEYKLNTILLFIGILLSIASILAFMQVSLYIIDDVFFSDDSNILFFMLIVLLGIYLLKYLGDSVKYFYMRYISLHLSTRLRDTLLYKIISLDMVFLYQNRSGELISKITHDINSIKEFLSSVILEVLYSVVLITALALYIFYINQIFALYVILVSILMSALFYFLNKIVGIESGSDYEDRDRLTNLTEVFNNSEIIKVNATEKFELNRFSLKNWRYFYIKIKELYSSEIVSLSINITTIGALALLSYIGIEFLNEKSLSIGEYIVVIASGFFILNSLSRSITSRTKLNSFFNYIDNIFSILDTQSSIKDGNKVLSEDINKIEFKNITLYYEDGYALKDINLDIKSGEKIAIVGGSGGGKSTFINMLLRYYDQDKGEIFINGVDIREFTQSSLKHHISLVTQKTYIIQDTLAANVAYGQEIDEEKVYSALELADATEFTSALENGIYTKMEEYGANLSGGQRQRVAIARAIYKHASLLLFDEATSALDNESQRRVQNAIDEYVKDKISITIAHRLSTIKNADKILVMEKGEIVALGTHEKLLDESEVYKRLVGKFDK